MSNSRKTPIPLGQGVVHLNDDLNGSNGNNKALMKRVKEYTKPNDEIFIKKLGLTPKEFNEYKKGNDVYFQYDIFLEIINNYKINQNELR